MLPLIKDGGITGAVDKDGGFHDWPTTVVLVVLTVSLAPGVGVVKTLRPIAIVRIDKYFKLLFLLRPAVKIFYWASHERGVFNCYFHGVT